MKATHSTVRIEDKFLEMMSSMPYAKITMKSLADELQMTRQNIYRHYSSKEQIFSSIIEGKLDQITPLVEDMATSITDETWDTLLTLAMHLIYENKHIVVATFNSGEDELLLRLMRSFTTRSLGHLARTHHIQIRNETYFKMLVGFFTGSAFYMFKAWAQDGADLQPASISKIHKSISAKNFIGLLQECEKK